MTDTIKFRKKQPQAPAKQTVYLPMGIDEESYATISDISNESGLPMRQIASILISFAIKHIEWED